MVLPPTYDLNQQVQTVIRHLSTHSKPKIRYTCIFGGVMKEPQMALTWCSTRQIGCWTWAFSLRIDKIIEQIRLDWQVWTATWSKELVEDLSQVKYVSNFDYLLKRVRGYHPSALAGQNVTRRSTTVVRRARPTPKLTAWSHGMIPIRQWSLACKCCV
ncbi:uncharacterized protein LOC120432525 [Culex pipiens pallens]|uniref:uncharacterized protein LOC120432525 n=1 Tax=Culex pipiens pallens TaxID=42434 RepID=UPI001953CC4B|nr:uncharacterized protein LOC120432525 [Culex pipiens pallens]